MRLQRSLFFILQKKQKPKKVKEEKKAFAKKQTILPFRDT